MMELVVRPTRMPGSGFALRGFTFPFAHRRLALWCAALGRRAEAREHWQAFLGAFTSPDPDLAPMVEDARRANERLQPGD